MRKLVVLFFFLIGMQSYAYEERNLLQQAADVEKLKNVLLTEQKWVKYPAYADREGWSELVGKNRRNFIEQGEKFADYEWKVVKATDYLEFTRSGDRSTMSGYDANTRAIVALFMAEMAEGKGNFIDPLINGIFYMCEMTSWSISAHMSLQQGGGSFPNHEDNVIELVSGDVGSLLSWIYYFLHNEFDNVSPFISKRLYEELDRRILTSYLNETRFWWMATDASTESAFVNNWNPWCNSNVLQCFLLLEKDTDRLAEGVYKTMVSVDKFINYTKSDGACEEGPSYWGHAAGKMYDYLQILYDATDGQISIFMEPIVRKMGEYICRSYVGNRWVVNFADASARGDFNAPLIYRYGKMVNSSEMTQFAAYLNKEYPPRRFSYGRDMYRTLATLSMEEELTEEKPLHKAVPFTWYPETEFCYIINDRMFLATKGGYNNESHNHNDIGTFCLYVDKEPFLIDVGVGTYTRKTFGGERYTIWTMQSDYHNLPKINGYSQKHGKQYISKNVNASSSKKSFSLAISQAYPKEAGIQSWVRSYQLGKNTLDIQDSFTLEKAETPNELNFMTWGEVDITQEGAVTITVNEKTIYLQYDKNVFTPSLEEIEQDDTRLSRVWGNKVYRISLTANNISNKGMYTIKIKI